MVSAEKNLPETFDLVGGKNVKWSVDIGGRTYSTPIIAGGKVFVGTNNERPRDPRRTGDFGVLMCFNESDGKFAWQHKTKGEVYGSALAADSKIYIGTRKGQFLILAAGRTKKILADVKLDSPVHGSATAANSTIYIATMKKLHALARAKQ